MSEVLTRAVCAPEPEEKARRGAPAGDCIRFGSVVCNGLDFVWSKGPADILAMMLDLRGNHAGEALFREEEEGPKNWEGRRDVGIVDLNPVGGI